ncbi:MAG: helix-turn-helix transcriptional regulator [Proteobacteria bacterium]|nr:helix-turn-helix transcriptional regulator [Pseudomonadota bacterium]
MTTFLSTREVAEFLKVNEKMIYTLVSEKNMPASKVTGKWLFPKHLVEQWIEINTINYPEKGVHQTLDDGVLVIAGSNDILLEKAISLYNTDITGRITVFGNLGSMGGLKALRQNLCHIASSHLLQDDQDEYNFYFAGQELDKMPVVVNFCKREQGILVPKGNPRNIAGIKDLLSPSVKIINRPVGTGTRLLFDKELKKAGVTGEKINGYHTEVTRHMDVGLEILSGRVDAGLAIRPVASLLNLDFIPVRWERYDLIIKKDHFFSEDIQRFLSILHDSEFKKAAEGYGGYDIQKSGKMVFQKETPQRETDKI